MAKQYTLAEFESAGLSVTGPVRNDNQDAILLPHDPAPIFPGSMHAVADGMGGYSNGGLASKLALQTLTEVMRSSSNRSLPPAKVLQRAVDAANLEVYKTSLLLGSGKMGTTLTAAYVCGDQLYLLHVGDCRVYLVRDGSSACLTSDHTVVGDLVRSRLIPAESVRGHSQRSVLTRAVGLELFVQPELSQTRLQIGDRIILCSDGIWSVIEDQEFAGLSAQAGSVDSLAQGLVDQAIGRKSDDNCSVVVIQIRGFRHQISVEPPPGEHGWRGLFRK